MWKPAERIKHQPNPGCWPTTEEAARSRWFSPIEIGPLTLEQRTWVPAMVPWRATDDGFVTDDVLDWYERFARGQPGGLVIEATGVRDIPSGPLLRIGHDRFIPGLKELADTVRRASDGHTRLFIQCLDFLAIRRRPHRKSSSTASWPSPTGTAKRSAPRAGQRSRCEHTSHRYPIASSARCLMHANSSRCAWAIASA